MKPPDDNPTPFYSPRTRATNNSSEDTVKYFRRLYESSPISQEPGNRRFFRELENVNSAASSTDSLVTGSFREFAEQEKQTFFRRFDNVVAALQTGIATSVSKRDERQNRS
jgi:hypothetical protein